MFLKTRHNPHKGLRNSRPEVFYDKDVLKSFSKSTGKQPLWGLVLIKLKTPAQMVFFGYCKIFKNTFFIEYLRWLLPRLVKISPYAALGKRYQ